MLWLRALAVWGVLLVTTVATAIAREGLLGRRMSPLRTHQVGTLVAAVVDVAVVTGLAEWLGARDAQILLLIGALWVVLTVAFEFVFGRLVMGHSWEALLGDYNLRRGRLWPLFLLVLFFAPLIGAQIRGM